MSQNPIRIGQLLHTFAPGSLYTNSKGVIHIVCGLDHWFCTNQVLAGQPLEKQSKDEFEVKAPRLLNLLRVEAFYRPPDHRTVSKGDQAPPNSWLKVPGLRFPSWYRCRSTGRLAKHSPSESPKTFNDWKIGQPENERSWDPVRFIAVCPHGHLSEFPWKAWADCKCLGENNLYLDDRGGADLASIQVRCATCNQSKSLLGTLSFKQPEQEAQVGHIGGQRQRTSAFSRAGIACGGSRPLLGQHLPAVKLQNGAAPPCPGPLVGALINQLNLHYPLCVSALDIPAIGVDPVLAQLLETAKQFPKLGNLKALWDPADRDPFIGYLRPHLAKHHPDMKKQVEENIAQVAELLMADNKGAIVVGHQPEDPESSLMTLRRQEFDVLRTNIPQDAVGNLVVRPVDQPAQVQDLIGTVKLVERLREVRAFYGFTRVDQPTGQELMEMPDRALNQLFLNPPHEGFRWLPATEVFGEGIYVELREDMLTGWMTANQMWLNARVPEDLAGRIAGCARDMTPPAPSVSWAIRFLTVHTLAHILINQLVFECGYSTASLRERLFISADQKAPMAGFMIYTSAGDSEGTMGGLVRLGEPDKLGPIFKRALTRAAWCSADPICAESLGGQGPRRANLAACHACVLLPETSCETTNHGLDRAMIVGTPTEREKGLFSAMVMQAPALQGQPL
jgi:hypothetical protein